MLDMWETFEHRRVKDRLMGKDKLGVSREVP